MPIVRSSSLLLLAGLVLASAAQELTLRSNGDELKVSAPMLHFLSGKPLERLRNGSSVTYDIHLAMLGDSKQTVLRRTFERFVISYDLWEEKFSVARMRGVRAAASHLSATAVEAWCLDRVSLNSTGLPQDRPFWVRLEVRAQSREEDRANSPDDPLSLASLIELFSRAGKLQEPQHWRVEAGPLRLRDVARSTAQALRGGS